MRAQDTRQRRSLHPVPTGEHRSQNRAVLAAITPGVRAKTARLVYRRLRLRRRRVSRRFLLRGQGSTIDALELANGTFAGWITECTLGGPSRIADSKLDGFVWDDTSSRDLTS